MRTRSARLRVTAAAVVPLGVAAAVAAVATTACAAAVPGHPPDPAVTASQVPVVINCFEHGQVRPRQYVLTCADALDHLTGLHWASWGPAAFASGSRTLDDCIPACAGGHSHTFPVLVALWRAESLPGHPDERYFARITLIYTGNRSYRAGGRVYHLPATSTGSLSATGGL